MHNKQNQINIKGTTYQIHLLQEDYTFLGLTNTKDKEIFLQTNLDNYDFQKTAFHELVHAYFFECGLIEYSHNETITYFLESVIFEMLDDLQSIVKMYNKIIQSKKAGK